MASMVQYSSGIKARISSSRSTISLTTTDCTLPGREARFDRLPQKRAELISDQPVEDAAGLLGVDQIDVDVARRMPCRF